MSAMVMSSPHIQGPLDFLRNYCGGTFRTTHPKSISSSWRYSFVISILFRSCSGPDPNVVLTAPNLANFALESRQYINLVVKAHLVKWNKVFRELSWVKPHIHSSHLNTISSFVHWQDFVQTSHDHSTWRNFIWPVPSPCQWQGAGGRQVLCRCPDRHHKANLENLVFILLIPSLPACGVASTNFACFFARARQDSGYRGGSGTSLKPLLALRKVKCLKEPDQCSSWCWGCPQSPVSSSCPPR